MYPEACVPVSNPAHLSALVTPGTFLADISAAGKADVLQAMARHATKLATALSAQVIFDVLWEREELGSTGIGAGIAVPHGRFKGIHAPVMLVGKTSAPIDFGAVDEMPTDLFFTLLAPAEGNSHIQLLFHLSRMFHHQSHANRMRYCQTAEQMHLCFVGWEAAC